jgi:flagellar biosynthesis/type III secretory pathway protein FliH
MEVQADPAVEPGGAIVQTEYGEIDASVTTQIQRARELVTAALVGDETLQSEGDGRDDAI